MSYSIISLNIEGNKHLTKVIPFLQQENPDFITLQEVMEDGMDLLQNALGMVGLFMPMRQILEERKSEVKDERKGVAIFSQFPLTSWDAVYYGDFFSEADFKKTTSERVHCVWLWGAYEVEGTTITVGTTHFSWTPDGKPNQLQHTNVERLLVETKKHSKLLMTGDFNAARGEVIFNKIAGMYTDTIPTEIKTTIDPVLHRAGALQYVVDGLFSTSEFEVSKVEVKEGLSDHCAIMGEFTVV